MRNLTIGLGISGERQPEPDLNFLQPYGITADTFETERYRFLDVPFDDAASRHLAVALAERILNTYEPKIIFHALNKSYSFLSETEKRKILSEIRESAGEPEMVNALLFQQRKRKVAEEINEYFEAHDQLNLDGFVSFRLKKYRRELDLLIEDRVEKLMIEKEYEEFIRLLKSFVDSRPAKATMMHVVFQPENSYTLLDSDLRPVEITKAGGTSKKLTRQSSDTLAGMLVEQLPRKIILHGAELYCKPELLETLIKVFTWRITSCKGCKLCSH